MKKPTGKLTRISSFGAIPLVVLKTIVACVSWAEGTARAMVRLVVVVVPEEVATYVRDHIGVLPPTDTVQGTKVSDAGATSVNPVRVIIVVPPRDHARPPLFKLFTVRVREFEATAPPVTSVPRALPATAIDMASGVPANGRPEMTNVFPGWMVLAAPAALIPMVTVRQSELVWQVPEIATEVTSYPSIGPLVTPVLVV